MKQNTSNRGIYFLITLGIIIALSVGVYALTAGTTPNPGHAISEMGVPTGCGSASALMWDGSSIVCGNDYIWRYRYFPPWGSPGETVKAIKTKIIGIGNWNMDSVSGIYLNYGDDISWDKVVRISVLVHADSDALNKKSTSLDMGGTWEISPVSDNGLMLSRTAGGIFDNTDFDYAYESYNRGWAIIDYYS